MTVAVLCNLAQCNTARFVDAIAGIYNPALLPAKNEPVDDSDPQATQRLVKVLEVAAAGQLVLADFAYVRAFARPQTPEHYSGMLRKLGPVTNVSLLQRRSMGDDIVSWYRVMFGSKTVLVNLGIAPDGKFSVFDIEPQ